MRVRDLFELCLTSQTTYADPFIDVELDCAFTAPSGQRHAIPGFFDGDDTWRVRFAPDEPGTWAYQTRTQYADANLRQRGTFHVEPAPDGRGFLRTCPDQHWGLAYESGEPCFVLGDTVYNLFGVAHCGLPYDAFLQRRAAQGHNLLRVRLPVSPFHPPEGYSDWQNRSTWPWGGSEQKPDFTRLNLDYFRTVDRVVQRCAELELGLEMIMQAWGFEYPFNSRDHFTAEYEALWMRYLIARYDAYSSVYIWTLQNEYEYYPDGNWHYNRTADLWAVRMARYVKSIAPHGHPIAVHNGPRLLSFADRFRRAPGAIDLVMFQDWGTRDQERGWLAAGIEDAIQAALDAWPGAAIFAEWGYERDPELPLRIPGHAHCDAEHTRRGAWRGAFCATGIIHGWERTWGPWWQPETDQPGMTYILHLHRFFTQVVDFSSLRPADQLVQPAAWADGERPLWLATPDRDLVVAYLPVGGALQFQIDLDGCDAQWFDPRVGALSPATATDSRFDAPSAPDDWVLVLRKP